MHEEHDKIAEMGEDLFRIRHSLAHVLAEAAREVRPDARLGFGPPVDNGFYYDFLVEPPFSEGELPAIEERMRRIVREGQAFRRADLRAEDAVARLREMDEPLKVEWANELAERGESRLSFYESGPFTDLCEGPHVASTADIPADAFKLDKVAGAYWRGEEKRPMLCRVYGLAFRTRAELDAFLDQRKLAEERDHRKLGRELELFHVSQEVGPGLPLWLPNGTAIREELEKLAKEREFQGGYVRVATPHITRAQLYYTSGHLPYYTDGMFPPMRLEGEDDYYLRPMNCPHHHMIYAHRPRSYRELPLRLAEYGQVYRYEQSGALSGLLRVRGMSMNDAHIYCRPDQIEEELTAVVGLHRYYYELFRLSHFWMRLSLHDPANKDKYIDDPSAWARTEEILARLLAGMDIPYKARTGEAAFYGPKIDFQIRNVVGREETASTAQLDFGMPTRFDLTYIGEDGQPHRPYIIHRAPLGTHERFVAFLIEHFGGAFPTWMAPVQVAVVPVADRFTPYARKVEAALRERLVRAEVDTSSESLNKKVRNATTAKVPNVVVVGGRDEEQGGVTWRRYVSQKEQVSLPLERFVSLIEMLRSRRTMDNFADVSLPEG